MMLHKFISDKSKYISKTLNFYLVLFSIWTELHVILNYWRFKKVILYRTYGCEIKTMYTQEVYEVQILVSIHNVETIEQNRTIG